ncbi:uncharacterized protein LOC114306312 [Camellia sinensis]|uniref:uncharacterized protein LOC114306312 n=1 Tax=Camellia sinensis TaxID=4442 RepID=UPI0010364048|nr:uncharacterized protein LOC114306312 [Camellia sinensis]
MDMSWMLISDRFSQPYVDGVNSFIEFAKVHLGEAREIKCPCINCCNFYKQEYDIVKAHWLISMIASYTTWLEHGELPEHNNLDESNGENDEDQDEYDDLIKDYQRGNFMEGDTLESEDMLHVKIENRWSNKSFDKENARLEKSPTCQASRYKVNDSKDKKIPHKILCYFPLTPRLRILYMSRKTAKDMRWHSDKRVDDGVGGIRLIVKSGRNLICIIQSFPGDLQWTDIDVYLRPLIDELEELWENGMMTYDASTKQTFRMHAAVMWAINDFPAYGDLSGWRTKGYLSCPPCNDNPLSRGLISKIGWVGHRAYLPDNHLWRKDKKFNGLTKLRKKSLDLPVEKVMAQLDQLWEVKFGKDPTNKKRPRESEELNWTKKSIMWELPYWKKLNLRHNLDVMHIEKNICENFYGTMLAIDGKNKDTHKARDDLQEMGIRQELHLQRKDNGSVVKPWAAYTLDSRQIDGFCEFLKSISYPDSYAANISRCVTSKNGRLSGMKSHDCHVLLQRLLPIGMRGFVNKEICTTLFELGNFFQELC